MLKPVYEVVGMTCPVCTGQLVVQEVFALHRSAMHPDTIQGELHPWVVCPIDIAHFSTRGQYSHTHNGLLQLTAPNPVRTEVVVSEP